VAAEVAQQLTMNITAISHTSVHLTRQTIRWDRRLRLVRSLLLGPRAIIAGLVIGVIIAAVARMRPWLLPAEVALLTAGITGASLAITLALVWLWPHPVMQAARYFDYRFDLKERVSTALELAAGILPYSQELGDRQLDDAITAANRVRLEAVLPLRMRISDIVIGLVLFVVLLVLLLTGNPQADQLMAQRELQAAIDDQTAALDDAIERIEQNAALSEEEQAALTEALREAREVLAQEGISQEEAVAALAQAAQQLQAAAGGMLPDQASAYCDAAAQMAESEMGAELAQAFNKPNLNEAASAAQEMAEKLPQQEMSEQDREQLAEQLERTADSLESVNPAVAQKLREAAEALRRGDMQAAQRALQEAAEMMRRQQEQLQNSPLAQSAAEAQQQLRQGQQQIAQAGQHSAASQQSQQSQQQQSAQSVPSTGEPQDQANQPGQQQSQSGQAEPGQQSQQGQPQDASQGQPQGGQGQGEQGQAGSQPSDQAVIGEQGGDSGSESQQAGQGGESAVQSLSQGQNSQPGDSGSASVGQGEGGAGTDTVIGQQGEMGDTSTGPTGDDSPLYQYQAQNPSFNLGGQSNAQVDIGGQASQAQGAPIREGEFGPNPQGQSTLSYSGVLSNYMGTVNRALESGRIPLDQRDVIHDYFSSLQR